MIKIPSSWIMAQCWRGNISLMQNCKGTLLALTTESKLLLVDLMEKVLRKMHLCPRRCVNLAQVKTSHLVQQLQLKSLLDWVLNTVILHDPPVFCIVRKKIKERCGRNHLCIFQGLEGDTNFCSSSSDETVFGNHCFPWQGLTWRLLFSLTSRNNSHVTDQGTNVRILLTLKYVYPNCTFWN